MEFGKKNKMDFIGLFYNDFWMIMWRWRLELWLLKIQLHQRNIFYIYLSNQKAVIKLLLFLIEEMKPRWAWEIS